MQVKGVIVRVVHFTIIYRNIAFYLFKMIYNACFFVCKTVVAMHSYYGVFTCDTLFFFYTFFSTDGFVNINRSLFLQLSGHKIQILLKKTVVVYHSLNLSLVAF